jgi:hypothetical protein
MSRAIAVAASLLAWVAVGSLGLLLLRVGWPAYAVAEPAKAYTTAMLLSRLGVAVLASLTAGIAAGLLGGTRAAWIAGAMLTAPSAWIHVAIVWSDYPAWYHLVYLVSVAPVLIAAARRVSRR